MQRSRTWLLPYLLDQQALDYNITIFIWVENRVGKSRKKDYSSNPLVYNVFLIYRASQKRTKVLGRHFVRS